MTLEINNIIFENIAHWEKKVGPMLHVRKIIFTARAPEAVGHRLGAVHAFIQWVAGHRAF